MDRKYERQQLTARLNQLTQRMLPAVAKERGYPVFLDHCFKRIVMDNATGAQWNTQIKAPFYRNAPIDTLTHAVYLAEAIYNRQTDIHVLNNRSLGYRGKQQKPLATRQAHR